MADVKTSNRVRDEFLDFFHEKGHEIVSSSSLVPQDDPTLLFTNAGMNQFKDVFLGAGDRPYLRAANTQKCLRVSGKHNDLEEVGVDTYHHTFFEMLGNWSFGDYFKKDAIGWAWELLVDRWGLEADRLYVTVHEGDEDLGLGPDDEAAGFWRSETGITPEHVLYGSTKDNFWMMGDTGPCGPCSEVHIDLRPDHEREDLPGASLVNANDPRVMEIWNLVFIQYDAQIDGSLLPLPAKHVDTGLGFERLVAVLQGKRSNYDTDLFEPVLSRIAELSPIDGIESYDRVVVGSEDEAHRIRVAMRVVADHARAITFAVSDGVTPGNVGRGYVIRRILRRAVRFGYQTLGLREPFMYKLVDTLVDQMSVPFPELGPNREYIEKIIRAEEESFLETLGTGLAFFGRILPYVRALESDKKSGVVLDRLAGDRPTMDLLKKAFVDLKDPSGISTRLAESASDGNLPGEVAFLLHDTYGFPIDLTNLMAREEGLGVDMEAYNRLMQRQKDRARAAASFVSEVARGEWRTVSAGEDSQFVGYDQDEVDGVRIRRVRTVEGKDGTMSYQLILDRTPFYSESGGQVGDTGALTVGDEQLKVLDTRRANGNIIHFVDRLPPDLDVPARAIVDAARRARIMKHHTSTHLLHAALRRVLGPHVAQKGSLVAPDHLRFDFSHYERVSAEQLDVVARIVNEKVQENIEKVEERSVPIDEALARGAMALFGEKYGERVRVITFDQEYSVELCGGTHVEATGEIGVFAFRSEGSIASGVRRVEAVAGFDALSYMQSRLDELDRVRGQFKSAQRPTDEEVADLLEKTKRMGRELSRLKAMSLTDTLDRVLETAVDVGSVRVATGDLGTSDMDALRTAGQKLRNLAGTATVGVMGSVDPSGDKAYLVAVVTDDVLAETGLKAGSLVARLAKLVGGGGGGRPELATAGGKNPEALAKALSEAPAVIASELGL